MSRTPASFKQADLARALRAVKQAELVQDVEIRIEGGTIRIIPAHTEAEPKTVDAPVRLRI
ncbi:hypothetical protein [uncultured Maritimibacter sp.]|jgi:hypothetical protein|uniref:hypothetical protein n=1 Tax=uncultured Maritimibacter sp. TaxID=991866 RepID=UPI00261654F2|nr:hypothetical protein [uncultured Maritimibacter sp.]